MIDEAHVTLPHHQVIHYCAAGAETGMPVVLLHGGGVDSALLSWKLTIPALAEAGYHVYAPHWPGYGASPPPTQPYSMDMLVTTLSDFLTALGVERVALVGISMGGGAAIGYTLAHPDRVSKLAVIGAYGLQDRAPLHSLSYFLVRIPFVTEFTRWSMLCSRAVLRAALKSILRNPEALTDDLLDEVAAAVRHPYAMKMFNRFQKQEIAWRGTTTCFMPHLDKIKVPVLIVHGSGDVGVDWRYAKAAAERIPNAQLHVFENAGHWTQRDYPDRFNALLLDFLRTR